ncbi:IS982 family transposase [Enterococcus thailandicus]|uniref:IS982 family transposase n=1 Tax=Enterococcus thailandicus TaxID=417368 RepID=UPI00094C6D7E|nr:IS982 family transposase [Enterococcus thailandicus]
MRSQLHYIETFTDPQIVFTLILEKVTFLYEKYVPNTIKYRKNIVLQKQSDPVVISCVLWALMEGHQNQSEAYRAIRSTLFKDSFPERSRFCRICQNLAFTIKLIRYFFIEELTRGTDLVIVDSMPCPLCKPIRNCRAKILNEIADIGYNATKKMHYYGVKLSFFVTESGFPIDYVVSPASFHDIRMVTTMAKESPVSHIIGDKGYLSKKLHAELETNGITITTPLRKNMAGADKIDDRLLGKKRKTVETVFSSLSSLGIQAFKSRSLRAFEFRLEAILLVYALMLGNAQKQLGKTLRYSYGRF